MTTANQNDAIKDAEKEYLNGYYQSLLQDEMAERARKWLYKNNLNQ